ncbi:MAG: aldo/keto reductase [Gammaproteobacteria bacterium]|nr:aldo/keto reductase [Gammaproteobacteria bacterium]
MLTRRDCLKNAALIGAAAALPACALRAVESGKLITRAIPKSGEELPIVGLGTSATFRRVAMSDDTSQLRAVIATLVQNGGTVLDTAPSYNNAEEISGQLAREAKLTEKIFWATKVNVVPRDSHESADPDAVRAQLARSFERIGKQPLDLVQVHDVTDIPGQMPIIEELRAAGKVRYIGTTSTRKHQYPILEKAMHEYPIDFIGIDYAVDNRSAAERILPLAEELGIAVLVYVPFGRTRLWQRTQGKSVPDWAQEFGAMSWGQFFIKYAAAHSVVTCVTPATSKPQHMRDNIAAAYGELPDAAMQRRMEAFVDGLPSA